MLIIFSQVLPCFFANSFSLSTIKLLMIAAYLNVNCNLQEKWIYIRCQYIYHVKTPSLIVPSSSSSGWRSRKAWTAAGPPWHVASPTPTSLSPASIPHGTTCSACVPRTNTESATPPDPWRSANDQVRSIGRLHTCRKHIRTIFNYIFDLFVF